MVNRRTSYFLWFYLGVFLRVYPDATYYTNCFRYIPHNFAHNLSSSLSIHVALIICFAFLVPVMIEDNLGSHLPKYADNRLSRRKSIVVTANI
jgi:hypothetical protein